MQKSLIVGAVVACMASFAGTLLLLEQGEEKINLAEGKPSSMSSVFGVYGAHLGNDGNTDGMTNWFHTDLEDKPWWQVDLTSVQSIKSFEVYNREDGSTERSRKLVIQGSLDGKTWNNLYTHNGTDIGGLTGREPLVVRIWRTQARYVRIQLAERNYLHLSEVRVFSN